MLSDLQSLIGASSNAAQTSDPSEATPKLHGHVVPQQLICATNPTCATSDPEDCTTLPADCIATMAVRPAAYQKPASAFDAAAMSTHFGDYHMLQSPFDHAVQSKRRACHPQLPESPGQSWKVPHPFAAAAKKRTPHTATLCDAAVAAAVSAPSDATRLAGQMPRMGAAGDTHAAPEKEGQGGWPSHHSEAPERAPRPSGRLKSNSLRVVASAAAHVAHATVAGVQRLVQRQLVVAAAAASTGEAVCRPQNFLSARQSIL